jgi:ABC-type branched-subunit amino acid transport system ATPase component
MTTDGLEIRNLTVAFGGNVAVNNVSLSAPMGRITGLIGPNGAGKTTTFNACSGLLTPTRGEVHLFGRNVTRARPAARARLGLGRTFQKVEICESMTVRENVLVGAEAQAVAGSLLAQFVASGASARDLQRRVDAAIERCGLTHEAARTVGSLSTGRRRLVELARTLACRFRLLLLDEPSSGLDDAETARFGRILRDVVAETGTGILLVEHDMNLVMGTCDYLHVLDFGNHLFEGDPAAVRASAEVRAAYLGEESSAAVGT